MSSDQLDIPSAAALVVVAGLVVTTVWAVPHQVVGQENMGAMSHIEGELVEPGNSIDGEVEDIQGTDHYKINIEQPGELTVNLSKSEGNESTLFASVHRMDDHRLINYTSLERGGQLTAEISESGMYYIEVEGDGYTDYSFTVNFKQSEADTPTDTETEPTPDTPTEEPTTDTPTEEPTPDTPTEEPTPDTPTEEPTPDTPTEEPTPDTPTEEPTPDTPTEEPTPDTPTEEPTPDTPTEEPTPDTPTEEPTPDASTEVDSTTNTQTETTVEETTPDSDLSDDSSTEENDSNSDAQEKEDC